MIDKDNKFLYVFVFLVIRAIIYKYFLNKSHDVTMVYSSITNKKYLVRNLPDKQQAADLLANMNKKFDNLINYLKSKDNFELYKRYVKKDNTLNEDELSKSEKEEYKKFDKDIKRLIKNYNPDALSENTPDSKYTSYSENKGQKIVFCIRSKTTNQIVKLNTIMFVALHEFAHLMTKSIGHTDEFWENFKILLRVAIINKLYNCKNYHESGQDYCGMKITDTPLKCEDV